MYKSSRNITSPRCPRVHTLMLHDLSVHGLSGRHTMRRSSRTPLHSRGLQGSRLSMRRLPWQRLSRDARLRHASRSSRSPTRGVWAIHALASNRLDAKALDPDDRQAGCDGPPRRAFYPEGSESGWRRKLGLGGGGFHSPTPSYYVIDDQGLA